jgi:hypothetical protein
MSRFGELCPVDLDLQAEAFARWHDRNGSDDWRERFAWWAGPENKDFQPGDAWAIASRVERIMAAGGPDTLTDPMDFLRYRRPAA